MKERPSLQSSLSNMIFLSCSDASPPTRTISPTSLSIFPPGVASKTTTTVEGTATAGERIGAAVEGTTVTMEGTTVEGERIGVWAVEGERICAWVERVGLALVWEGIIDPMVGTI